MAKLTVLEQLHKACVIHSEEAVPQVLDSYAKSVLRVQSGNTNEN
jgi:hypothetical protein